MQVLFKSQIYNLLKCWTSCLALVLQRPVPQGKGRTTILTWVLGLWRPVATNQSTEFAVKCLHAVPCCQKKCVVILRGGGVCPECKTKEADFFRRKDGELTRAQKIISYHSKTINKKASLQAVTKLKFFNLIDEFFTLRGIPWGNEHEST